MKLGFLGLGRLGLPIAAILSQHHEVIGYDPAPSTADRLVEGHPWEADLDNYLGKIKLSATPPTRVDAVIVAVQTPHHERLDGTWPDDGTREPFDLSYLESALRSVGPNGPPVVVMSTVLPGDCARLAPLVSKLVYAPAFPAMGTTVRDVLDPEFILVGHDGDKPYFISDLIAPIWPLSTTVVWTTWETAELAKVAYNTFIGMKLAATNTVGWLAEKVGADGGDVMTILRHAGRRIVSDAYMEPGLGDGGACHPRDAIAMSWLAREHGVYDLFGDLIAHREAHSEWIADTAGKLATAHDLPVVILGAAYKANSTLTDGSPALLLANQTGWHVTENPDDITSHSVVVIGVPHDEYRELDLPPGSIVVDVWGHVANRDHLLIVRPGRR